MSGPLAATGPARLPTDDALQLALSSAPPTAVSAWLREQVAEIAARGGRTESTRRAYTAAALRILPFLQLHHLQAHSITPELAATALLTLGLGHPPYTGPCASSSVRLTATAIRVALVSQGQDPSAWCSQPVRAILRELDAVAAPKAVAPIRLEDLRRMLAVVAPAGHGIRIRAALVVAYAGALRVSELASITWGRIGADGQDLVVQVRRKRHADWCQVALLAASDQSLCPVAALGGLRQADALTLQLAPDACIFGAPRTIQGWVAAMAKRAGLRGSISPHSLRHGWASDAAAAGISLPAIQRHLGHSSATSTARYARHADLRAFY